MSEPGFVPSVQPALSPISLYWQRRLRRVSVTHKSAIVALHSICWSEISCHTCAAIAAFARASSVPAVLPAAVLSPRVRPGVAFQFVLAGSGARGAAVLPGLVPTTRPGWLKGSASFEEREQMLPIVIV